MRLTDSVADMLQVEGFSGLFVGRLPSSPDNSISIYQHGGPQSDSKHPYDTRAIQLWVRGTDPLETLDRAEALYVFWHGRGEQQLPGDIYLVLCVGVQSGPVYAGQDQSRRYEYSLNLEMQVKNPSRG